MVNVMSTSFASKKRQFFSAAAVVALLATSGAYMVQRSDAGQPPAAVTQAVPVITKTLVPQKVHVWSEFSGRLYPVDFAEIRPEVSGRITKVWFDDGQIVQAGDVLMVIDPRPYEAAVDRAEANLASARTNADFTKVEQARAEGMVERQAIPVRVYDERKNNYRVAAANVKAAEAELERARLDLDHAYVKAPISGRISRAELTVGNLVQAGSAAPLLTSIVSNNEVYADFQVDEQTYVETIRGAANGRDQEQRIPVQLTVRGAKEQSYNGFIFSFDNHIDIASGTIRARAKFNNADGVLLPGMFVSVSLAGGNARDALLIPERAVSFDQSKKFVYVVGDDNKVAYREVKLGKEVQAQRIVLEGLQAGDRVIVEGVQRVKPDTIVEARDESTNVASVN
jgi:multidrug efflux system membrane fusion protein